MTEPRRSLSKEEAELMKKQELRLNSGHKILSTELEILNYKIDVIVPHEYVKTIENLKMEIRKIKMELDKINFNLEHIKDQLKNGVIIKSKEGDKDGRHNQKTN